jgi:putative hydrolases of HD superfamily
MQPLDPADPRRPYVQIAASIRAAILNGELEPGQRLPSTGELAAFFGVAKVTVGSAVRILREEGFVRSRAGSGTYVQQQARLPGPDNQKHPLAGAAAFLYEMGTLKNTPRSGWLRLGIQRPESVAEHSLRAAMAAYVLATLDGQADPGHTVALAVFHDAHEVRVGDVDAVGRAYIRTSTPEAVTRQQVAAMPDEPAKGLQALTDEYETNQTIEAKLAHDSDKLDLLMQAIEYAAMGYDTAAWRDSSLAALRTAAGQQLAQAIQQTSHKWWAAFDASYAALKASTRGRLEDH